MSQRMLINYTVLVGLVLVFSQACTVRQQSLTYDTVPQPAPPSAKENSYGRYLYHKMCDMYPLDASSTEASRIRSISDELTRAAGLRQFFWNVHLFHAPEIIDIRAVEGNRVFVWSGLLDTVASDDELAAVLAWEMGHSLARHTKPVKFNVWSNILFEAAEQAAAIGLAAVSQGMVNITGASGWMKWAYVEMRDLGSLERTYNANQEKEAAQIALHLLARSSYDPQALKSYWARLHDSYPPNGKQERLSRKISPEERLAMLDQLMGEIAIAQKAPAVKSKADIIPVPRHHQPEPVIQVDASRNYIILKTATP